MIGFNEEKIILRVRLTPNSSSCVLNGFFVTSSGEEYIKINVVSVPEKGKANAELIKYLAKSLKIAKSEIEIVGGELDRYKKIELKNTDEDLASRIKLWLGEMNK